MIKHFYGTIEVTPINTKHFKVFTVTAEFEYYEPFKAWHGNNNYYNLSQSRIIEIKEVYDEDSKSDKSDNE